MADGYAYYPRSSPPPAQTMSNVSPRNASLEVQRPLRNEQGDNLEQSKKNTISTSFFHFSARSKASGQCRSAVLNWSECLSLPYLAPSTRLSKANRYLRWIDCSRMHAPHALFVWTCSRSHNDLRHFIGDLLLSASPAAQSAANGFFFFFFFLLSIAQRIGSKPLPPI